MLCEYAVSSQEEVCLKRTQPSILTAPKIVWVVFSSWDVRVTSELHATAEADGETIQFSLNIV